MLFVEAWTKSFDGICSGGNKRIVLAGSTNSLNHCQSLCHGDCNYVSYKIQGNGHCLGSISCINVGDHVGEYVTYEKIKGNSNGYGQFEISI